MPLWPQARPFNPGFRLMPGMLDRRADAKYIGEIGEILAAFRDGIGPDTGLLFDLNFNQRTDGFMRIAKAVEPYGLTWLEMDIHDAQALAAIRRSTPPVLLVDEVDRADEEFEAFLLELLSDFQVSIPELGTIKAISIPRVVLTSNGTRELSDALRRRCLYHYVDIPDVDREARIILTRLPGIDAALALQVARMVAAVRKEDLRKVPGVAETLDWAAILAGLEVHALRQEPEAVHETMICLLKTHEDRARLTREVTERLLGTVA